MEEVFDLRTFIVMLFKKFKLIIILAVVFAILGGAFGIVFSGDDLFTSTASASVNTIDNKTTDATALTSIMTNVKETVTGDYFYTGILASLKDSVKEDELKEIFGSTKSPSISALKKVIEISVNGNLVLVNVTVADEKLSARASEVCVKYVIDQLKSNINNVQIQSQGVQTVNKSELAGDTAKSRLVKFGILGFGGGIVIAVLWIFFFDVFDLKVRSADDLKKYNLPVLGEITEG